MIALATAADAEDAALLDIDRLPLEEAFDGRADAEFVRWHDEGVDWSRYELVVLRSTWGYQNRLPEFGRWLRAVAAVTRVLNSVGTVEWNLDKAYLGALGDGGVPVVRTGYVDGLPSFDRVRAECEAGQIVVKPTVSASSDHTGRFDRNDPAARELAERILAHGKRVMLQPYYESVTQHGEISVVHFDGAFSHAFRKGPILEVGGGFLGGGYAEVVAPAEPTLDALSAAEAALAGYAELVKSDPQLAGASPLLYSRVDLIVDAEGRSRCLELELIEPSFYFSTDEKAAGRFVDAVLRRL